MGKFFIEKTLENYIIPRLIAFYHMVSTQMLHPHTICEQYEIINTIFLEIDEKNPNSTSINWKML